MCGNNACLRFAFVGTKSLCVCTLSFLGNGRGYSCSLYALVIYAPCIQHPPVFSPSFHGNCTPCISNAERRPLPNSLSPCFIFTSTRSPPLSVSLPLSIYLCILCFCSLMKPHGTPPSFQYMERIPSGPLLPSLHSSSLIRDIVCLFQDNIPGLLIPALHTRLHMTKDRLEPTISDMAIEHRSIAPWL